MCQGFFSRVGARVGGRATGGVPFVACGGGFCPPYLLGLSWVGEARCKVVGFEGRTTQVTSLTGPAGWGDLRAGESWVMSGVAHHAIGVGFAARTCVGVVVVCAFIISCAPRAIAQQPRPAGPGQPNPYGFDTPILHQMAPLKTQVLCDEKDPRSRISDCDKLINGDQVMLRYVAPDSPGYKYFKLQLRGYVETRDYISRHPEFFAR